MIVGAVGKRIIGDLPTRTIDALRRTHRMKIDEVEGIGGDLRRQARRRRGCRPPMSCSSGAPTRPAGKSLEDTTGISGKLILEWVNHVDLMRIKGVGSEYSDLLEAAGVDSPAELANRNAANLAITLQEVVAARPGIVRRVPSRGRGRGLDRRVEGSRQGRRALRLATMGGFRSFLTKTNALALAIGVIIGVALGSVVTTLVNAIIMPPIGWVLGSVDFASIKTVLGTNAKGEEVVDRLGTVPQLVDRLRRGDARRLRHQQDLHQGGAAARPVRRGGPADRDPRRASKRAADAR